MFESLVAVLMHWVLVAAGGHGWWRAFRMKIHNYPASDPDSYRVILSVYGLDAL
jgi:hypothetical protein